MNQRRRSGRILVVEDVAANAELLRALLVRDGYSVAVAVNGEAALEAVRRHPPDLVLLDVMMPGLDGFEVCRTLKQNPDTRLVPVVLVTSLTATEDRIRGIEVGADDFLTKPFNPHELKARVRSLMRVKRYTDELDTAESVIVTLALTIEARDTYTEGHCQRLADYATALGRRLGLGEEDLDALRKGGFLHDIGKVGIPDSLLMKRGRLSPDEYELMKQHAVIGDKLCGELRSLQRVRPIVRHHHEHLDGSGYPDGVDREAIPLLAQIMAVCDVYDALVTARPYKPAFGLETARDVMLEEARKGWWRRDLVDELLAIVEAPTPTPRRHASAPGSKARRQPS